MSKDSKTPSPRRSGVVTLKDVAERCGVNIMTVSRALRFDKHVYVSQATAERVRAMAVEMGYNPANTLSARRLAAQRHQTSYTNHAIALFFPPYFSESAYHSRIYHGIVDVVLPEEYAIVIVQTYNPHVQDERSALMRVPNIIARGEVDGILTVASQAMIDTISNQVRPLPGSPRLPIVGLAGTIPGTSSVTIDDFACGELAVGHLLDLGHRSILVSLEVPERMAGYQAAYTKRGILLTTLHRTDAPRKGSYAERFVQPMCARLAAYPEITAIVAPNDLVACDIAGALYAQGLRIPEDISLMGNDDTYTTIANVHEPTLTTVRVPLEAMGRIAAQQLFREIADPAIPIQTTTLPVELVVRASTCPCRKS